MKILSLLIMYTLCILNLELKAQVHPDVMVQHNNMGASNFPVMQSPNTAAIKQFGAIPVNLFAGLPDITIQLYENFSSEYGIPLTLRYDAGGVLAHSHASWVGTNWRLEAGGCIIRSVHGLPDEYPSRYNKNLSLGYNTLIHNGFLAIIIKELFLRM